ncbi:unnamed protein product [Echinostoma caproni]|uniref:Secreted protein n=1 Tax=Echinostoma caproni TaxID=27848 RepID=A0A183AR46_9TREM|nr:unnamed protein product [Echinostoma caproni]
MCILFLVSNLPARSVDIGTAQNTSLPENTSRYDNLAELYAVINTIQCLQKAYIKDQINSKEISNIILIGIQQLMDCPAALERIKEGRPITIKDDKMNISKSIADFVSQDRCDALRLGSLLRNSNVDSTYVFLFIISHCIINGREKPIVIYVNSRPRPFDW